MSDEKWTKPNRLTEVIRHEVWRETVGHGLGPSTEQLKIGFLQGDPDDDLSSLSEGDDVWLAHITTRTGLDKDSIGFHYFSSEERAEKAVATMPVGTTFGEGVGYPFRLKDLFQDSGKVKDGSNPARILSMLFGTADADDAHFTCYHALVGAGVKSESNYGTSELVLGWVGEEHIAWMRETFGENWECVAEFEYCLHHFPTSSLASLAAKLFLSYFITYDDFAVGYLTKEIQAIAGGTEQLASVSAKARKRAGEGGGKSSSRKKTERLSALMEEIENLSSVVGLMSEDRIVAEAFERVAKARSDMPRTPKTQFEYAVELRSSEPFKSRYEMLFQKGA